MKTIKYTIIFVGIILFFRLINGILPAPAPIEQRQEIPSTVETPQVETLKRMDRFKTVCATQTNTTVLCHKSSTMQNFAEHEDSVKRACKARKLVGGLLCALAIAQQPVGAVSSSTENASESSDISGNWWKNILYTGFSWLCVLGILAAIVSNVVSFILRGRAFIRRIFWGEVDDQPTKDTTAVE